LGIRSAPNSLHYLSKFHHIKKNYLCQGIGWWHYEFCYGRHVTQFHENKDGSRITILLGTFSALKHIEWIKKVSSSLLP
jgi:hypothetical protein